MNLDNYIEGDYDHNNPTNINDDEEIDNSKRTVSELIDDQQYYTAIDKLSEARNEINKLREYCKQTENTYVLNRLNNIYQIL